jgi:galactose mutarotase-like enzyme
MIEIRNQKIVAKINSNGAELIEIYKIDGKNLLWNKDDKYWNRVAPNLFPIVGRLKNDQYHIRGEIYEMKSVLSKASATSSFRLRKVFSSLLLIT